MGVENTDENVNVEAGASQEPQYSDVELKAMELGWRPKEDYKGDPDKFRDAETYVLLQPFFEKIEGLSKKVKNQEKAFHEIAKQTATIRQQEYSRAVATLKAERKQAMIDGDIERATHLEDQIDHIKEQREIEKEQHQDGPSETDQRAFESWQERNPWFERDEDLQDWANARAVRLVKQGVDRVEVLRTIEKEVKAKFPEKFTNPNRARAGAVEGSGNKASSKSASKLSLSPEEAKIRENIVRTGALSYEEYDKQFQELNK